MELKQKKSFINSCYQSVVDIIVRVTVVASIIIITCIRISILEIQYTQNHSQYSIRASRHS